MIGSTPFPQNLKDMVVRQEKAGALLSVFSTLQNFQLEEWSMFQCSILLPPEENTVANSTVVPLILHLPSVSKQIHLVSD